MDLEGKWKAILVGGLVTGLTPLIPFFDLACCLIPLLGGIVAVGVYRHSEPPHAVNNNDGIALGLMSGLTGTVIYAALVIPLVVFVGGAIGGIIGHAITSAAELPPQAKSLVEWLSANVGRFLGVILFIKIVGRMAISLVFGLLGGIFGVALFKK